jgi:Uma2 family endonuclease
MSMSIATAPPTQRLLTAEEFMQLPDPPDGSHQELVRGRIETMPPPQGRHGIICSKIDRRLGTFVETNQLGWVTANDAGVILGQDPDTVRGPDIAYYSRQRVPEVPDGYFLVPPDLAVEVVSPNDTHTRVQTKVREYLRASVPLVWVVDPEGRTVTVYRARDRWRILEAEETLSGEDVLPGFSCPVADLFS